MFGSSGKVPDISTAGVTPSKIQCILNNNCKINNSGNEPSADKSANRNNDEAPLTLNQSTLTNAPPTPFNKSTFVSLPMDTFMTTVLFMSFFTI